MNIKFVNKVNKEACSITSLIIDDKEIALDEVDLRKLFLSLLETREDLFDEHYENQYANEVEKLKNTVEELENELNDSNSRVEELEDILDEEGIDY